MGNLGSKTHILYFQNNYSKRALKNYTNDLQPCFPHFVKRILKTHEDKAKSPLLTFASNIPYMLYFR